MNLEKMLAGLIQRYGWRKQLIRDARTLGSMEWAKYFKGWFDDVSQFSVESDGNVRLHRLGISVSPETARWLLNRNMNYGYCLELQEQGVTFSVDSVGLLGEYRGGRFLLEPDTLVILWELLCQNAYRWTSAHAPTLIFAVGMNVGFTAIMFAIRHPYAEIVGFEPFGPTFERLKRNLALNPQLAGRITACNIALSEHDAEEKWYRSQDNAALSSQFDFNCGMAPELVRLRSATLAMQPALDAHPGWKCVVKMDCEGGEYAILKDWAASGFAAKVDLLAMEYHEFGGHLLADLEKWFCDNGFTAIVQPLRWQGKQMKWGAVFAFPNRAVACRNANDAGG